MKIGSTDISAVYIGDTAINKVYIGSTEIWTSFTGLLDTYPGAAAAYSLRQLKSGITNAIQVRRSSDDEVLDIGFVDGQLDTGSLEAFVNAQDVAPADYGDGAAAAYSLRYVSDSYTGPVIKARRDSNDKLDFTPTEITDGTLATWSQGGNVYVEIWYDQSGNGNNASQTTAANQPQIVNNGSVVTENGKPALDFDGTNDALIASSVNESQPTTYFTVAKRDVTTGGKRNLFDGLVSRNEANITSYSLPIRNGLFAGAQLFGTTPSTNQELQMSLFNGASSAIYINGSLDGSGGAGSSAITSLGIGRDTDASDHLDGKYQELILYPSDQSSNRVNIETNINSYYGIYSSTANGYVRTWYDQSGNGYDASQTTTANQPQIVSSGSVVLENGKPAVQFDGSNDSLQNNVYKLNPVPFTILATVQFDTASGYKFLFDQSEGSTAGALFAKEDNKYRFYYYTDLINLQLYNTATNTQELATLIVDDGLQTFHVNSISRYSESTSVPNNPVPTYNFVIGADPDSGVRYFQGNLQELIIYPSDQSFNRTGIETNINVQYNIYWDGSQTSLLDSYGGSAAAYSLRALSSVYTGPLVRVRRASDNAEQDIYAKYDGTLNTDALESFCSGTNGFVKTWYDQSGNARDATQTTTNNQPQIVSGGSVITRGGKPSIFGDGSNDYLQYSDTNFPTGDISFDLFHVEEFTETPNNYESGLTSLSAQTYVTERRNISFAYASTSNGVYLYGGNTIYTTLTNTFQLNNINYQGGGGAIGARINASNLAVSSFNNTGLNMQSNTNFRLFSGQTTSTSIVPNQGYISEAIYYFSDQSSNRTGIENNINDFYSIY